MSVNVTTTPVFVVLLTFYYAVPYSRNPPQYDEVKFLEKGDNNFK